MSGPNLGISALWGSPSVEPFQVTFHRFPEEAEQLRVVQISDVHFGPFTGEPELRAAVEQANAAAPDLVVLTGDFVTSTWLWKWVKRDASQAEPCAEILRHLRARHGIYAVLGNHDWATDPEFVAGALESAGIRVLRNESVAIENGGGRIWLGGVDGAFYGHADMDRALAGVPSGEAVILLAHEPDFADVAARFPVDLQLSGHSHAGQICAPGLGPLYLPPMGKKYPAGAYRVGEMLLYTNRGLGVHGVPLRLLAPPEVSLFDVAAGEKRMARVAAPEVSAARELKPETA